MIETQRHTLSNGLTLITHVDRTTPMAAVNVLYKVGARNENPDKTGFAHLFEHLMFGGSKNIPSYDTPLQYVGGDNNAFTTNDYTNYYLALPADNLETAFWLESDRMLELAFSPESLEVQRKVVIEEFQQRYFNQPYGDIGLYSRPLVYKVHPYQWSTIGKKIEHIESATLDDVKDFFYRHYAPNNAVLTVTGNIDHEKVVLLAEKWFAPIERQAAPSANIPQEPQQTERRELHIERNVPADYLQIMFHMGGRTSREYYICDMLTDLLADGTSSRLIQGLVKEHQMMGDVNAYITGDIDPGMLALTGTLLPEISMDDAENALMKQVLRVSNGDLTPFELEKIKNRNEASMAFSEMSYVNKAMNLAYYENILTAEAINKEIDIYNSITIEEICNTAAKIFVPQNTSVLYYHAKHD